MLGLKHGENRIVEYCSDWPSLFEEEQERIQPVLGGMVLGIEHFGSTSVPGLPAKPIIDILVGVSPLKNWSNCRSPLESLGYDYAEHAGVPDHYIFGIGSNTSERTHLLHIVEYRGTSWMSNLRFRNALRDDPELRDEYCQIKRQAVEAIPLGRAEYTDFKTAFVSKVRDRLDNQA